MVWSLAIGCWRDCLVSEELALVTGAAGAIGSTTVRALLDAGLGVVGFDRAAAVAEVAAERYVGVEVDVRDVTALAAAVDRVADRGRLRHLVGIAGGALRDEPLTQHDPAALAPDVFRASVELNLVSQFQVLHAVLPWLRASGPNDRSITLTSSFNALSGQGMPAYSAAKAGLVGMMYALTAPLGSEGIRVNVVAPGTIATARTGRIWEHAPDHFERLRSSTALGRLGTPEDVARVFVALATQLTHVTGQVIVVDGGQLTVRR